MKDLVRMFLVYEYSGEILYKLKASDLNATTLPIYDFSTLYTALPYNLIKDKLINFIERTFQPYLARNTLRLLKLISAPLWH